MGETDEVKEALHVGGGAGEGEGAGKTQEEESGQPQGGGSSWLCHLGIGVHALQVWPEVAVPFLKGKFVVFQILACREQCGVRGRNRGSWGPQPWAGGLCMGWGWRGSRKTAITTSTFQIPDGVSGDLT